MIPSPGTSCQGREAISEDHRTLLLATARKALEDHMAGRGPLSPLRPERGDPDLPHHGVFVTLHYEGRLRGCIGNLNPGTPLATAVRSCAVSAAGDPRFKKLKRGELEGTTIQISVLTPGHMVTRPDQIRVGRDGLMVRSGTCRGLLLPQVAVEHGWGAEQLLEETCRKAGLPPDAWSSRGAVVEAFGAEVFCETSGGEAPLATAAPPDRRC